MEISTEKMSHQPPPHGPLNYLLHTQFPPRQLSLRQFPAPENLEMSGVAFVWEELLGVEIILGGNCIIRNPQVEIVGWGVGNAV